MALSEFLERVRRTDRGFQSLFGLRDRLWSDPPDEPRVLRAAYPWMTPEGVAGYDPADLSGLPTATVAAVTDAVERFRTAAAGVSAEHPPTLDQFLVAAEALTVIYDDLEALLEDPEGQAVFAALWAVLRTPEYGLQDVALGYDFEVRPDADGDPAVVVWLVVPDDADVTRADFQSRLRAVRRATRQEFAKRGIDRWPFVRVRSASETREVAGAVAP